MAHAEAQIIVRRAPGADAPKGRPEHLGSQNNKCLITRKASST